METNLISATWLNGHYYNICGHYNVTIDTSLSFVCFEDPNDEDDHYTFQGDEGNKVIDEINYFYNNEPIDQEEAVDKWCNLYL